MMTMGPVASPHVLRCGRTTPLTIMFEYETLPRQDLSSLKCWRIPSLRTDHAGSRSEPPQVRSQNKTPPLARRDGASLIVTGKEEFLVLGRPGSDLLSQGLSHSTIGAEEFNGRVRDGIGFMLLARTTRP